MTRKAILQSVGEAEARRVIMTPSEKSRPLRANIFVAETAFKCNVLQIQLSEFDKNSKQTWLDIKD